MPRDHFNYSAYLDYIHNSDRWAYCRDHRKLIDRYKCQDCGATGLDSETGQPVRLEVHHRHYGYLFRESSCPEGWASIVTLCSRCHRARHPEKNGWRNPLRTGISWAALERRFRNLSA